MSLSRGDTSLDDTAREGFRKGSKQQKRVFLCAPFFATCKQVHISSGPLRVSWPVDGEIQAVGSRSQIMPAVRAARAEKGRDATGSDVELAFSYA